MNNRSQHLALRKGNFVSYLGSINQFYRSVGKIVDIDKFDNRESYLLEVGGSGNLISPIRAYSGDVAPIALSRDHLERLGFQVDEKENIFRRGGLVIIRPFVIGYHTISDMGFVVVEKDIPNPADERSISENTVPVMSIHSLQNYFDDYLGEKLDLSLLFSN